MSGKVFHDIAEGIDGTEPETRREGCQGFSLHLRSGREERKRAGCRLRTHPPGHQDQHQLEWKLRQRQSYLGQGRTHRKQKHQAFQREAIRQKHRAGYYRHGSQRRNLLHGEQRNQNQDHGRGKVIKQSLMPGTPVKKGSICIIELN